MPYIYVLIILIGVLSSLLGMFLFVVDLLARQQNIGNHFSLFVAGLVLIALGDIGSKLSNLRKDFDFFLNQQRRPSQRFLHRADDDADSQT